MFILLLLLIIVNYVLLVPINGWLESSLSKICKDRNEISGYKFINLWSSKNENVNFQIVLNGLLTNTKIEIVNKFMDGLGNEIENDMMFYKIEYFEIMKPSDFIDYHGWIPEEKGLFPDALIPFIDPYDSNHVIVDSFDVDDMTNQGIWVDIYVSENDIASNYTGVITVSADGMDSIELIVNLNVWNFSLPVNTNSLKTTFTVEAGSYWLINEQYGVAEESTDHFNLRNKYYDFLIERKMTPRPYYPVRPKFVQVNPVILDFNVEDPKVGNVNEYYEKIMDQDKYTALYIPNLYDDEEEHYIFPGNPRKASFSTEFNQTVIEYYQQWWDYVFSKGWEDRTYIYIEDDSRASDGDSWVSDEPYNNPPTGYIRLNKWSDLVKKANEDFLFMISDFPYSYTKHYWGKKNAGKVFDMYATEIEDNHKWVKRGEETWLKEKWYAINVYSDAVSYHGTIHRSAGWFSYKYDLHGFELWEIIGWPTKDPFKSLGNWEFGAGAGSIIYPGKHFDIPGPISSIRTELIRKTLEDYEYFKLIETMGGGELGIRFVKQLINTIIPMDMLSMNYSIPVTSENYEAARSELAKLILKLKENPIDSILFEISGTITDENGNPIENIFVQVGELLSTFTDKNGFYSLLLSEQEETLYDIKYLQLETLSCHYEYPFTTYEELYLSNVNVTYNNKIINVTMNEKIENYVIVESFETGMINITDIWDMDCAKFELSKENVVEGEHSAKLTFPDNAECAINVGMLFDGEFDYFEFDFYWNESIYQTFTIQMGEWLTGFSRSFYPPPFTWTHVRIPIKEISKKLDFKDVYMEFFTDNLRLGSVSLYLDNIRLVGNGTVKLYSTEGIPLIVIVLIILLILCCCLCTCIIILSGVGIFWYKYHEVMKKKIDIGGVEL